MAQFDVYKNTNRETRKAFPFLLDVQSDLIGSLATRVVVPCCPASRMDDEGIEGLTPIFEIAGDRHIVLTPQLAGISRSELGTKIANLVHCREAIMAALDLLITGI